MTPTTAPCIMAILDPMPTHLRSLLSAAPAPGNRNAWLFQVARNARRIASATKVRIVLQRIAERWPDRDFKPEIDRAVHRAFELPLPNGANHGKRSLQWPAVDAALWAQRAAGPIGFGLDPLSISTSDVLDSLFPGDPLLCMALDVRSAHTQPRSLWRHVEAGLQFIVANAMLAPTGLTQDGRESARCLANACKHKRYQVVEFDHGTVPEQAAVLTSLQTDATPLVLVVWSGGKSLHGWYDVDELDADALTRYFGLAVAIGADASLWDPSKLVRLPGGRRSGIKLQPVLHFSPPHV
jgi:hypothetical protein